MIEQATLTRATVTQAAITRPVEARQIGQAAPCAGSFDLLKRLATTDSADAACAALALFVADDDLGALVVELFDPETARCLRWSTLDATMLGAHDKSDVVGWLQGALPADGRPGAIAWSAAPRSGAIVPVDARVVAALDGAGIAGGISVAMVLADGRRASAHILSGGRTASRLTEQVRDVFLVLASQVFLILDRSLQTPNPARLTRREIEVLRLAARGLPAQDMATSMGVTVATIRFHLMGARRKFQVRTTREAIAAMNGK